MNLSPLVFDIQTPTAEGGLLLWDVKFTVKKKSVGNGGG